MCLHENKDTIKIGIVGSSSDSSSSSGFFDLRSGVMGHVVLPAAA